MKKLTVFSLVNVLLGILLTFGFIIFIFSLILKDSVKTKTELKLETDDFISKFVYLKHQSSGLCFAFYEVDSFEFTNVPCSQVKVKPRKKMGTLEMSFLERLVFFKHNKYPICFATIYSKLNLPIRRISTVPCTDKVKALLLK